MASLVSLRLTEEKKSLSLFILNNFINIQSFFVVNIKVHSNYYFSVNNIVFHYFKLKISMLDNEFYKKNTIL